MDKLKICEAMYALPNGVVVRRHKSFVMPAVLLLSGIILLGANKMLGTAASVNVSSALVFIGISAAIAGAIILATRIGSRHGVPFHSEAQCYLSYEERYYDPRYRDVVAHYVASGDLKQLLAINQAKVPSVTVALYHTPDNSFAAMQAFEYADLEYRPLTELKIVN